VATGAALVLHERENEEMARGPIAHMHRISQVMLVAALVMLGAAFVAYAAKAHAVTLVFLVLMLVCAMASSVFAVIFRNRAVAAARASRLQAQQKARR
jgi:predicted membrane channel-forming protein YqfA (hemolysin III family)